MRQLTIQNSDDNKSGKTHPMWQVPHAKKAFIHPSIHPYQTSAIAHFLTRCQKEMREGSQWNITRVELPKSGGCHREKPPGSWLGCKHMPSSVCCHLVCISGFAQESDMNLLDNQIYVFDNTLNESLIGLQGGWKSCFGGQFWPTTVDLSTLA